MPTSDLDWSSYTKSSIFPVYSNKRKATNGPSLEAATEHKPEPTAKRRCAWQNVPTPQLIPHQPMGVLSPDITLNNNNNMVLPAPGLPPLQSNSHIMAEMNHNSPGLQDQHALHEQACNPALSHVMSQQPPRVPSPWPSQHPFHIQTTDHIMDLNEGTYNAAPSEMETASSAMESDCSPDPTQYTSHHTHSPNSDFCKSYCGVGETSPSSGRVRCFCKPSWEGMLDMKPYVSDVY